MSASHNPRPDRITTVALDAVQRAASAAIEAAAGASQPRLVCVRGDDARDVSVGVDRVVEAIRAEAAPRPHIVTVGVRLSQHETSVPDASLRVSLRDVVTGAKLWRAGTVVVAPRADAISDDELGRLMAEAWRRDWRLVLGVHDGEADGVVDRRLAVAAAARLAPCSVPPHASREDRRRLAAARLRAGYIEEGIFALASVATIDFPAQVAAPEPSAVTVRNARSRPSRATDTAASDWQPGARVVATRTDYRVRPPRLRAGRLYEIVARQGERAGAAASGDFELRDVVTGATVAAPAADLRPARVLTIREARAAQGRLTEPLRLVIADIKSA